MKKIKIAVIAIGLSQLFYWFNLPLAFASDSGLSVSPLTYNADNGIVSIINNGNGGNNRFIVYDDDTAVYVSNLGEDNANFNLLDYKLPGGYSNFSVLTVDNYISDWNVDGYCISSLSVCQNDTASYRGTTFTINYFAPLKYLTVGSTTAITDNIGELFSNLWFLFCLAVGIPLAFWFIKMLIAILKAK